MSRIASALMPENVAFAKAQTNPMVDLRYGGQMGFAPELSEWVSNQSYIRRNLIAILVEAPRGFASLPDPDYWYGTLRALVELHAIRITGLQAGLEVETVDTPVGGGGQVHEDFTDVKEARSQVTFSWNEKYGMPVQRFLDGWIRYLMMDPNSKYANINTIQGNAVKDMLADVYSMSVIFIEPDPTHTRVVKAWLGCNMWPKGTGEITGQRDLSAAGEPANYDVQFTGIYQYGPGVNVLAQRILDSISITGANPYLRESFIKQISADVLRQNSSYSSEVQTLAAGAIKV